MPARHATRLPLGAGMDTKSDERHIGLPQVHVLKNVDLRTDGAINKRRALKSTTNSGAGDVATLVGGNRRVLINADATHGSVARINGSTYDSPTPICPVTSSRIAYSRKGSAYTRGMCAVYDGKLALLALEGQTPVVGEVDPDTATLTTPGYPADRPATPPADSANHRILSVADHGFLVVWGEANGPPDDIKAQLYINGAYQGSPTTLVSGDLRNITGPSLPGKFDAVVDATGDVLYLAYQTNALGTKVLSFDITGTGATITITATGNSQTVATAGAEGIAITLDTDNSEVALVTAETGGNVVFHHCPVSLTIAITSVGLAGLVATSAFDCNVAIVYLGSGDCAVYYNDVSAAPGGYNRQKVVQRRVNTQSSPSANVHEMHGCMLIHAPVAHTVHGNQMVFFGVVRGFEDSTETMYVTVASVPGDSDNYPTPVAAYQYETAASGQTVDSAYTQHGLSPGAKLSTATGTRIFWAAPIRTEVRSGPYTALASNLSMGLHSFDLSAGSMFNHAHAHETMLVAGGAQMGVVGNPAFVAGHLGSPDLLSAAAVSGAGVADGDYHVRAVYEFLDQAGRLWQSRPSVVGEMTAGGGNNQLEIKVATPIVANVDARLGAPVQVALYLTTVGGTSVHYRHSAYSLTPSGWLDALSVDTTITNVAGLSDNTVLYTDTQELEHYPPPPCVAIVKHKNRFAAIHAETGDIWLSLEFQPGEGIAWNPAVRVINDDPADIPVALVSTDSALMVLYKNRIGHIYGDGPNKQGVGQPFSTVQFLPDSDVGAISQRVVAKLPAGVFFCDGDKGWHIMPYGGGAPQYVGRDMDGAPTQTIIGTAHLPDRHEVRVAFYTAESVAGESASWLTYHYDKGQWSLGEATDHDTANLYALADGNEFLINGVGEDTSAGYDGTSTYVEMRLKTGWIVLPDAVRKQGLMRLWKAYLFAVTVDDHDLKVQVYYNYDESSGFDTFEQLARPATGSSASEYIRIDPSRQLVEAVKFEIWDEPSGGTTTGEGTGLSDFELHYGIYPASKPRRGPASTMTHET